MEALHLENITGHIQSLVEQGEDEGLFILHRELVDRYIALINDSKPNEELIASIQVQVNQVAEALNNRGFETNLI